MNASFLYGLYTEPINHISPVLVFLITANHYHLIYLNLFSFAFIVFFLFNLDKIVIVMPKIKTRFKIPIIIFLTFSLFSTNLFSILNIITINNLSLENYSKKNRLNKNLSIYKLTLASFSFSSALKYSASLKP